MPGVQHVVAGAAVQDVVARPAVEPISALLSPQDVIRGAPGDLVGAGPAADRERAGAAGEHIGGDSAVDDLASRGLHRPRDLAAARGEIVVERREVVDRLGAEPAQRARELGERGGARDRIGGNPRVQLGHDGAQVPADRADGVVPRVRDEAVQVGQARGLHELGVDELGEVAIGHGELGGRGLRRVRPGNAGERLGGEALQRRQLARVDEPAAAGWSDAVDSCPAEDQAVEERAPPPGVGLRGEVAQQPFEHAVPGRGLQQVPHPAEAHRVRQHGERCRNLDPVGRHRVHAVGPEPDVGGRARAPADAGERADELVDVAAGIDERAPVVRDAHRLHTRRRKRPQLRGLAEPVPVGVAPHPERGEGRIARVDLAVAAGVERRQRRVAVGRLRAARQAGVVAEQLAAGFDDAIAVEVADEESIVRGDPARALGEPVGVVVEVRADGDARGLHAVAVEVEREGTWEGGGSSQRVEHESISCEHEARQRLMRYGPHRQRRTRSRTERTPFPTPGYGSGVETTTRVPRCGPSFDTESRRVDHIRDRIHRVWIAADVWRQALGGERS